MSLKACHTLGPSQTQTEPFLRPIAEPLAPKSCAERSLQGSVLDLGGIFFPLVIVHLWKCPSHPGNIWRLSNQPPNSLQVPHSRRLDGQEPGGLGAGKQRGERNGLSSFFRVLVQTPAFLLSSAISFPAPSSFLWVFTLPARMAWSKKHENVKASCH